MQLQLVYSGIDCCCCFDRNFLTTKKNCPFSFSFLIETWLETKDLKKSLLEDSRERLLQFLVVDLKMEKWFVDENFEFCLKLLLLMKEEEEAHCRKESVKPFRDFQLERFKQKKKAKKKILLD